MNGRTSAFALLALGILLSCDGEPTAAPDGDLAAARVLWAANHPASYEYTLRIGCYCSGELTRPVVVSVTGNTVRALAYADDGTLVAKHLAPAFPSIEGLFDIVAGARSQEAARADATFDATVGYPLSIALDYSAMVADDERSYTVSGFMAR